MTNVIQKLKFDMGRVENIVGKGENVVTSIFFFSHYVFKRPLTEGRLKLGLCANG